MLRVLPQTKKTRASSSAHLEHQSSTLRLLVTTQLEVLATLQCQLQLGLARGALETQHNLLGGLSLLVEDRLGLTTVTRLLPVVALLARTSWRPGLRSVGPCRLDRRLVVSEEYRWHVPVVTSLTLGEQGGLASLVYPTVNISVFRLSSSSVSWVLTLGDLVQGVLLAVLALAVAVYLISISSRLNRDRPAHATMQSIHQNIARPVVPPLQMYNSNKMPQDGIQIEFEGFHPASDRSVGRISRGGWRKFSREASLTSFWSWECSPEDRKSA